MNFRVVEQRGLENARSPFRVIEDSGQEVEWVNRFLDQQRVRSVVGSSRVDLQACKLEYSIVSPK